MEQSGVHRQAIYLAKKLGSDRGGNTTRARSPTESKTSMNAFVPALFKVLAFTVNEGGNT